MTDLVSFCRAHGVILDREPPIGVWRRYKTEDKPRHRNGSVKFMGDVAFVQNHATMDEVAIWRPDGAAPIARDDKRLLELRRYEERRRVQSVLRMRDEFASYAPLRGGHPYLEAQGLGMEGCSSVRVDGDLMVVPMSRNGFLFSYQTISPDGTKKYRAGCPVKGCSLVLSHRDPVVTCLAEGFATGLAIYQPMPAARVIVCFDAGNMVEVAKELNVRGLCVVCADNDHETASRTGTNPGIEKGRAAAEALGCGMAYPEGIRGSDWADALQEWGEKGPGRLRVEVMRGARPVA